MPKRVAFDLPTTGVPDWVRVVPLGSWEHPNGAFSIDAEDAQHIVVAAAERGVDIVFDYEHQTLSGERAPAAGWIKELEARDDGVWARVEWTDEARALIETKQYRYYSPTLDFADGDARLHSVALTNTPLMGRDIQPLAAKAGLCVLIQATDVPPTSRSNKMELKDIAAMLGLAEDSTEDAVRAKLAEVVAQPSQLTEEIAQLKAQIDGLIEAKAKPAPEVQAIIDGLQKEVATLTATMAQREATQMVESAVAACKITPAQRAWAVGYAARDPQGFAAYMKDAPSIIAAKADAPPADSAAGALTAEDREVCRLFKTDPKAFAEHKAKLSN